MSFGRLRQTYTTLASTFGTLIMGLVLAWPSYTTELYLSETDTPLSTTITKSDEALLGSLPSLGAIIGSGITGITVNYLGRRNGGVMMALPVLFSWVMISVTTSVNMVLAARFFAGITGGAALVFGPMFISEVAEDAIRGTLASAPMFMYSIGALISYIIGWCMTYRSIIWVNLFFSVLCIILIALVTESPVYLLRKNRDEDAKLAITKYRGAPVSSKIVLDEFSKLKQQLMPSVELVSVTDVDIKTEVTEKVDHYDIESEKPQSTSAFKLLLLQPSSRRAFIVVTTIVFIQSFIGLLPVQVYAKTVFQQTDPSMADIYTIFFAIMMLAGSGVTLIITDKAGRRLLFITSSVLIFVCMMTLGILLQTKVAPPLVTVLVIFAYSFSYMFGAGSIPFVLVAEVFIPEVQTIASMILIELVWFLNFLIIAIFPLMNSTFGIYGAFYIFGLVGLAGAVVAYFILPETKGLSNAQIQDAFAPRRKK